jgi:putative transposase
MGFRSEVFANGEIYHVYNQAVARERIFVGKRECMRTQISLWYYQRDNPPFKLSRYLDLGQNDQLSQKLDIEKQSKTVSIFAYCLMPNHYHLLVRQEKEEGITKFMSNWQNSFAKYYNKKNNRRGTLFLRPFRAVRVETEEHLVHLSRYIHLNPVTGYIVNDPEDIGIYEWSSWSEYMSDFNTSQISDPKLIQNYFDGDKDKYRQFVLDRADYQRQLKHIEYLTLKLE